MSKLNAAKQVRIRKSPRPTATARAAQRSKPATASLASLEIPKDRNEVEMDLPTGKVKLTNLQKLFWPEEGITKRDLLHHGPSAPREQVRPQSTLMNNCPLVPSGGHRVSPLPPRGLRNQSFAIDW